MGNNTGKPPEKLDYDISIIRPEMRVDDVSLRGRGMSPERLRDIKKGLLTLQFPVPDSITAVAVRRLERYSSSIVAATTACWKGSS